MRRPTSTVVWAVSLLLVGWLVLVLGPVMSRGQDEPKPQAKLRGTLPPNFRLLGLTEEQKQQIYRIQNDYDAKIAALEAQIKKLKTEERQAIEKVLTDAQRARLREILKEKGGIVDGGAESKGGDGKP